MTRSRHLASWIIGGSAVCLVPTAQGWKSCEQVREEERSRNAIDCSLTTEPEYSLDPGATELLELMTSRVFDEQSEQLNLVTRKRASELKPLAPIRHNESGPRY